MNTTKIITTDQIYSTHEFGFSQAMLANGLLFTSGTVGWDKDFNLTGDGSFEAQLYQSLVNLEKILEAGNSALESVVLIRFYVKHLNENKTAIIRKLINHYYPDAYKPSSTVVGIQTLARENLLVEIESIATTKTSPI